MKLYKKAKKSKSNLKELELCPNTSFLSGPCLLYISSAPYDTFSKRLSKMAVSEVEDVEKNYYEITNEEEYDIKAYRKTERLVSKIYRSKKNIQDILIKLKALISNIELLLPDSNNVLNSFNIPEYNIELSIDTSISKNNKERGR